MTHRKIKSGHGDRRFIRTIMTVLSIAVITSAVILFAPCEWTKSCTYDIDLVVTNQGYDQPSSNISIKIDGNEVFSQQCLVGNQHNFLGARLRYRHGRYHFSVHEKDTNTTLEKSVLIDSYKWIVVEYYYDASGQSDGLWLDVSSESGGFA